MGIFLKIASWFYKQRKDGTPRRKTAKEQVLIRQFEILDSSIPGETQLLQFKIDRLSKILLCIVLGIVISILFYVVGLTEHVLSDNGSIDRPAYGEGSKSAELVVSSDDRTDEIAFEIKERVYTKAEVDTLFEQAKTQMERKFLAKNSGAEHVTGNLFLMRNVDGFPFDITWESSAYDLVDMDGTVLNEELEGSELVTLTATFRYEDYKYYCTENVVVCPPEYTEDALFSKAVREALTNQDEASMEQKTIVLPKELQNQGANKPLELNWREANNWDFLWIIALMLFAVVMVYLAGEQDALNRLKERDKELLRDYSELIGKLTLYLSAGMTIRNTFFRIADDYLKREYKKKKYLYEEILLTCRELKMGVSEVEAYEHFGKRCRLRQYIRLAAMLSQNLKKGSNNLSEVLKQESAEAFEVRKNNARKLGEEAGTKLLGPMMLMLCVVMVIIIIPAYLSFSM